MQQLIGTTFHLCITGYNVLIGSVNGDGLTLTLFFSYAFCVISTLFIYCYIGECLIQESLKLEIETIEKYNLKSSELTHVGSNDLEYVSQEAGITCNKQIMQKQSSFIEVFKDNKKKRTYAVLAAENDKIEVDDSDNSESSEENSENAKKATKAKVPPPLIMHGEIQSHQRFQELLKQNLKNNFFIKYKKERVELHTSKLDDFNHIKEKWVRDNIKFHTYTTKDDKRKTYVIYGMHHGITSEDIKLELKDLNIVVYNVNAMRGTSRPKFMVTTSVATKLAQLQDKSMSLSNAFYHYEWYTISPNNLKSIQICMLRMKKPQQLTSGKFCVLSLTTFTEVSISFD
ncbi:hypothetical protein M0802_001213 [Mischocyttarus mexicanus]|nr:hypothetical protein M0802_001213 [Mischocyttarus mexicanus]